MMNQHVVEWRLHQSAQHSASYVAALLLGSQGFSALYKHKIYREQYASKAEHEAAHHEPL